MEPSEQEASSSDTQKPFVANGRQPKGEFKTWKSEKPTENFKERRARRIAAHQAILASKNKLKEDGLRWVDAHRQFTTGEDAVVDDEEANTETTWEEIDYDTVREAVARQMLDNEAVIVDSATQEAYRAATASQWDAFYRHNKKNFFKDRNYLGRAFKELEAPVELEMDTRQTLLEVGSGVGNTLFPLVDMHPNKHFYAFDCSAKAIELLKQHPSYMEDRVRAFVCDITREDIPDSEIEDGTLDYVTMIFMLSAVPPEQMDAVLQRIHRKMKVGGMILFRDYGVYDMTQMRFYARKTPNKLGENFYRRSDGTFTYFFSLEVLADLFQRNGFDVVQNIFDTRVLSNRKRKIRMYRVWAQCKFVKRASAASSSTESSAPNGNS